MIIHGMPFIASESDKKKDYCNMVKIYVSREPLQRGPVWGHIWSNTLAGSCRSAMLCFQDHIYCT